MEYKYNQFSNIPEFDDRPDWLARRLTPAAPATGVNEFKPELFDGYTPPTELLDHNSICSEMERLYLESYKSPTLSAYVHTLELTYAKSKVWTLADVEKIQSKKDRFVSNFTRVYGGAALNFPKVGDHVKRINCCSYFYAFRRFLETGEIFKIGQSLCKSKVCPTCGSILSKKRQNLLVSYLLNNNSLYSDKYYYHGVFTFKHDEKTRNNYYVSELLSVFLAMRKNKYSSFFWSDLVYGGIYSIEVKQGVNSSPHIHLHSLLICNRPISKEDLAFLKSAWLRYTKDSSVLRVDPVYAMQGGQKVFYDKDKHDLVFLSNCLRECIKYVSKFDFDDGKKLADSILNDFLTAKCRLFSRFGSLYSVKELNIDYKDLADLQLTSKELFSPQTGEIYQAAQTEVFIAGRNNVKVDSVDVKNISYTVLDYSKCRFYPYDRVKDAQKDLALSFQAYVKDAFIKGNKIVFSPCDSLPKLKKL